MKKYRKFTLIELIAVIVILAIVAVIAVAKLYNIQEDAKRHSEESVLAECINTVSGAYYQHTLKNNGEVPDIANLRAKTGLGEPSSPSLYNEGFRVSLSEGSLSSQYVITIHEAGWDITGVSSSLLSRTIRLDSTD